MACAALCNPNWVAARSLAIPAQAAAITRQAGDKRATELAGLRAKKEQELAAAMSETDATIAAAETNVTAKLAKSAIDFKAAVIIATHQLDDLQRNVSSSLALMSGTLRSTSADLNAQVESAKVPYLILSHPILYCLLPRVLSLHAVSRAASPLL